MKNKQGTRPERGGLTQSVPNSIIRSSLFSVARMGNDREFLRDVRIASMSQYSVSYTGLELNQRDCEVFYACITAHRNAKEGDWVDLPVNDVVRALKMKRGGSATRFVWSCMERIATGSVRITFKDKREYVGALVSECANERGSMSFRLSQSIVDLFSDSDSTFVCLEQKASIGSLLGKWLFDFHSSHSVSIPISVESLMLMCGTKSPKNEFTRQLKGAMEELLHCPFPPFKGFDMEDGKLITYNRKTAPLERVKTTEELFS